MPMWSQASASRRSYVATASRSVPSSSADARCNASSVRSIGVPTVRAEKYDDSEGAMSVTAANRRSTSSRSMPSRIPAWCASTARRDEDQTTRSASSVRSASECSSSTRIFRKADVSRYSTSLRQRSERRSSSTSAVDMGRRRPAGSVLMPIVAGRTRPDATNAPAPPTAVGGTSTATRFPRSVMPTLSPARTRRTTADECCWSSRTGTVFMRRS